MINNHNEAKQEEDRGKKEAIAKAHQEKIREIEQRQRERKACEWVEGLMSNDFS